MLLRLRLILSQSSLKLTIKIAVEEGIVTARFITENLQVKHLLESNLNTLRQSLESQGIKVEKLKLMFSLIMAECLMVQKMAGNLDGKVLNI